MSEQELGACAVYRSTLERFLRRRRSKRESAERMPELYRALWRAQALRERGRAEEADALVRGLGRFG